jgi:glutamate dehydrogenase
MNSTQDSLGPQIDAVHDMIMNRLAADQAGLVARFAREYFRRVDPDDISGRSVPDLYGAVLSHWHFASRHPGGARVRVYNPRLEEHGWESTHTIIEIVNDDMPFLVDSVTMEVNRLGLTLHLIIHPVLHVARDAQGVLSAIHTTAGDGEGDDDPDGRLESIMHLEVDRRTERADLDALQQGLERVLADVRATVADWPLMRERLAEIIEGAAADVPVLNADDVVEARAFLQWLADDNCVLLGARD